MGPEPVIEALVYKSVLYYCEETRLRQLLSKKAFNRGLVYSIVLRFSPLSPRWEVQGHAIKYGVGEVPESYIPIH